ncbi:hypothetical protein EVAR_4739_1 [Eumeta japonica]|uniref:Uncharacterized protein n=1 Tax=Eumeta variegata TaxID=151549 RepID=A0A4C1SYS1_EUMVA|nr:hypothetical protein EVAR_4739_1 [Eumeta japonica]
MNQNSICWIGIHSDSRFKGQLRILSPRPRVHSHGTARRISFRGEPTPRWKHLTNTRRRRVTKKSEVRASQLFNGGCYLSRSRALGALNSCVCELRRGDFPKGENGVSFFSAFHLFRSARP